MYAVFDKLCHGQSRRIKVAVRRLAKQGLTDAQVKEALVYERMAIKVGVTANVSIPSKEPIKAS